MMTPQEEAQVRAQQEYPKRANKEENGYYNSMVAVERAAFIAGYTADRWIDCKVRLPERQDRVVVFKIDVALICFSAAVYVGKGRFVYDITWLSDKAVEMIGARYIAGVTHWQPIAPPKTNEG